MRPFAHSRPGRAKRRACVFSAALIAALPVYSMNARSQSATEDPCGGPSALLAIMDRPTVSDSACVVPEKQVVLELGGQWTRFRDGSRGFNLPEAEFRAGIPGNNELVFLPPNYLRQTGGGMAASGPSATVVGLKHELGYTGKWLGAVESLVTLPSGSAAFGSQGVGAAFNGIVNYDPTESTSLSMMLGVATQTLPDLAGGGRYTSLNPDFVGTWQPTKTLQLYGEIYGQSSTGPGQGAGWNGDGGVQYLLTESVEVDVEAGLRLAGNLGGLGRYVGVGLGFKY
jgi:hypothetical protein